VRVRDEIDRSVVTIRGDGTFAPGSATLLEPREALMTRNRRRRWRRSAATSW
jgi:type VI secretion system protein ImpK